jgi:hypothetical protein
MTRWLLIAAIMGAVLLPRSATAQLIPGKIDCKYDPDVASYFPEWRKSDIEAGSFVHVCKYSYDGHNEAEYVSPPVKDPQTGVCIVRSMQVYLAPAKDGHLVQSEPDDHWKSFHRHQYPDRPLTHMQPARGQCPVPGDKGYIRVIDVPDGTFHELLKLWRAIVASPAKFDQNLALVPAAQKEGPYFERLKAVLTDPTLLARVRLRGVATDPEGMGRTSWDSSGHMRGVPDYLLQFDDPDYPTQFYSLAVDWVDGGFTVIGVAIAVA